MLPLRGSHAHSGYPRTPRQASSLRSLDRMPERPSRFANSQRYVRARRSTNQRCSTRRNCEPIFAALIALFGGGHLLVEGVPDTAKTLLVRTLARLIGGSFRRIQFTPDLMPADVIGTTIFDQRSGSFSLRV